MGGSRADTHAIPDPPAIVYPGAPLRAVAMEVYFGGVLDALSRFATFQRRHADEFDRLYVPRTGLDSDDFDLLRPVLLLGKNSDRGIAIASNQVSVITYPQREPYPGFDKFAAWGLPVLREALDVLQPARAELTRVGFRYENVIDSRVKGDVDLSRFFTIVLPGASPAEERVRSDVRLSWRRLWPTGTVFVSLTVEPSGPVGGGDTILLNISAERKTVVAYDGLDRALREAHGMARATFEALITDDFRTELEKERRPT